MPRTAAKPKLRQPQTASYKPQPIDIWGLMPRELPIFTWIMVRYMLWDQTIKLGLAMREAPIHSAELAYKDGKDWQSGIKCDDEIIGKFVERQLRRFWTHDLRKVLRAQIWGWAAGECLYRRSQSGQIEYDGLLQRSAADVRALEYNGKQIGVRFRRIPKKKTNMVDLEFPECFWHAFMPEDSSLYGNSVLRGPYSAWCDKYLDGGALDVRRLFMHADAYGGKKIRYPEGSTPIRAPDGTVEYMQNLDIARQMVAQLKAGGVPSFPSKFDDKGNLLWDIEWAKVPSNPQHILQYPKDLDVEMLRGLEIPDDVLTSEGMTGAWAGKAVPQQAFYAGLDRWLTLLGHDFKRQIADPLVWWNFGREHEYEISFKPLAEQASEQSGDKDQKPGGSSAPVNPFAPQYQQMSLEQAIGEGAVNAAQLVRGVRKALSNRHAMNGSAPQRMGQVHAPHNMVVAGKQFRGGEFIPGDVLAKASPTEKQAIQGGASGTKDKSDHKQNKEQKAADAGRKFSELIASKSPEDQQAFRAARADGVAIPPAWTEVVYHGKEKNILAEGRDAKGRKQRAENPAYRQKISDANNARISAELTPRIAGLRSQLRADAEAGDEEAKVLYLISLTGFRIGGKGDGKAKVEAFGASTIRGEHVAIDGNTVTFDFPGKKGVRQQHAITDPMIAAMMRGREPAEPVFTTRDTKVREAWQTRYGGTKVHDIRHVVATEIAAAELATKIPPPPKTQRERMKIIKEVAASAGAKLGNNPSQALGTYIDPQLWNNLQVAA